MSVIPPTPMIGSLPPWRARCSGSISVERRRSGRAAQPAGLASPGERPGPRERGVRRDDAVQSEVGDDAEHGVDLGKLKVRRDLEEDRDAPLPGASARPALACRDRREEVPQAGLVLQLPKPGRVRA